MSSKILLCEIFLFYLFEEFFLGTTFCDESIHDIFTIFELSIISWREVSIKEWYGDIRIYTIFIDILVFWCIPLCYSDLEYTSVIKDKWFLYRSFSIGFFSYDDGSLIILKGSCYDFRRRCWEAIDKHDEWYFCICILCWFCIKWECFCRIIFFCRHSKSVLWKEKWEDVHSGIEISSAIISKIKYDSFCPRCCHILKRFPELLGRMFSEECYFNISNIWESSCEHTFLCRWDYYGTSSYTYGDWGSSFPTRVDNFYLWSFWSSYLLHGFIRSHTHHRLCSDFQYDISILESCFFCWGSIEYFSYDDASDMFIYDSTYSFEVSTKDFCELFCFFLWKITTMLISKGLYDRSDHTIFYFFFWFLRKLIVLFFYYIFYIFYFLWCEDITSRKRSFFWVSTEKIWTIFCVSDESVKKIPKNASSEKKKNWYIFRKGFHVCVQYFYKISTNEFRYRV